MDTLLYFFLFSFLLLAATPNFISSSRPASPKSKPKSSGIEPRGFFGSGDSGFEVPGLGNEWGNGGIGGGYGYGSGYGGPSGGCSKGGVIRPSVVCKEKGPCYKKKLTCPAKCFISYSRSGKNFGAGGGGGGCTIDCESKCIAYC